MDQYHSIRYSILLWNRYKTDTQHGKKSTFFDRKHETIMK